MNSIDDIINNIRCADDTVADSLEDLEMLVVKLNTVGDINFRLKMKSYNIVLSKSPQKLPPSNINNKKVERIQKFKYLGILINKDKLQTQEIDT